MISPVKIWRSQKKIIRLLGKTGKIISFSRIFVPPAGFENEAPYVIALVEFKDGEKHLAQLVDWDQNRLFISQKVKVILRKTRNPGSEGVIPYGIKFKPL
jgi:uncharacterized OB-fold protein